MHSTPQIETSRVPGKPTAFSLTELLVASAIALVIMGGVAQLFSVFGRTSSQTQALVDLGARLRTTSWRLRQDLSGVTAAAIPWNQPQSSSGYIEIIEGPTYDSPSGLDPSLGTIPRSVAGDADDAILFTTQSPTRFVGRLTKSDNSIRQIESPVAEVAWFCRVSGSIPGTNVPLHRLHRRQMLVVGYVGDPPFLTTTANVAVANTVADLPENLAYAYDISLRRMLVTNDTGNLVPRLVPNTLADLVQRENRFMRSGTTAWPHAVRFDGTGRVAEQATFAGTPRENDDVILQNVLGFDVRVFDPECIVRSNTSSNVTLLPGDPWYEHSGGTRPTRGGYVDLGFAVSGSHASASWPGQPFPPTIGWASGTTTTSLTSAGVRLLASSTNSIALTLSATNPNVLNATYDTWSLLYESNGLDDDRDNVIDEGTDGLDSNSDGIPDNPPEYETSPPYPVPLRGLEVRIRCYEPTSRQVRQTTIRHTFLRQ